MAKILTAASVKNLKPDPSKRLEIPDGGCRGLLLLIYPSGKRSFIMRLRRADGRMGKLYLGQRQPIDAGSGSTDAMEVQNKRAQGVDPFLESIRKESLKKEKASNTFGSLSRQFIEQYARPKLRGWRDTAVLLGLRPFNEDSFETIPNSLADRWSNKPVATYRPRTYSRSWMRFAPRPFRA